MATAVGLNMKITADTAGIGRGINKTEQMLGKLSKSSASAASSLRALVGIEIGTRLASAFAGAARAASDYALGVAKSIDETAKLAQRTGIAIEALQGFQVAADLSGVQNLEGGLQRLTITLGDAAAGSATAQKAFANIGLSFEDLMGMAPEDQFRAVASAISAIPDQASQAAAAMDLFGRTGVELLPLFASNLEEVEARANRLGVVLSGDQTAAIEEMNDSLDLVRKTFDGIIGQVTANLAPVVSALAEEFLAFVDSFNGFGGGGGSGIADALTNGLLDFAEYMAGIFDAAIAQFNQFGVGLQAAASVFEFATNVFVGISETLRAIFNTFELVGNGIALALGKFLEELGSWVSSDLEQFGKDFQANALAAGKKNLADLQSAGEGITRAASAAVFGGPGISRASEGPAGRAVAAARERFSNRNSPDAASAREAERAQRIAQQQQAAAAAAAKRAAESARKAEEDRLKAIERADEAIAKAEEDRAKRAAEIEADRLDALSRRSNEALSVGDIRSGGISEVLRIAAGREDPAIEEYRKQLAALRQIDGKIGELRADKVKIIGGAGRAA
jgi:hypothetical protein